MCSEISGSEASKHQFNHLFPYQPFLNQGSEVAKGHLNHTFLFYTTFQKHYPTPVFLNHWYRGSKADQKTSNPGYQFQIVWWQGSKPHLNQLIQCICSKFVGSEVANHNSIKSSTQYVLKLVVAIEKWFVTSIPENLKHMC